LNFIHQIYTHKEKENTQRDREKNAKLKKPLQSPFFTRRRRTDAFKERKKEERFTKNVFASFFGTFFGLKGVVGLVES
jgi:hypothetical protein